MASGWAWVQPEGELVCVISNIFRLALYSALLGSPMLVVARRTNQKIIIADDIEITILEIGRNRVRFGIQAPTNVAIQTKLQSLPEPETTSEGTDQPPRTMAAGQSGGKR